MQTSETKTITLNDKVNICVEEEIMQKEEQMSQGG